ncbi:MAG: MGDG synthase family glycosyltransferase [Solirubrobacteraceae bacterium]
MQQSQRTPSKVLILSGEMGEGHNAAAAAITAAIADVWPGCEVERFDTLELWGKPFARAASWGYEVQMRLLPLSYEIFYDAICRSDRFATLSKWAIGRFFGKRLQHFLGQRDDDLVISTYPFGSAALHWLRENRSYHVPTATYIPAFHIHPVWAYEGIGQHFVMYDSAPVDARTKGFERTMRVGAPPVRDGFGTIGKQEARQKLRWDAERFIVLVTGGAWGLGGIAEAVRALIDSDTDMQVVAVCGKSERLAEELRAFHAPEERLRVYGYVDNMHEIMAGSDVVITNGAGVTVLEALRTPRPVIAFRPLAGHGKASTAEMVRRELAVLAPDVPDLVDVVARLASDAELMARLEQAGRTWVQGRELRDSIREMELLFAPAVQRNGHGGSAANGAATPGAATATNDAGAAANGVATLNGSAARNGAAAVNGSAAANGSALSGAAARNGGVAVNGAPGMTDGSAADGGAQAERRSDGAADDASEPEQQAAVGS